MRHLLFACLVILAGVISGCGPARPLTESEFKGFCYQLTDGESGSGCSDIITICDAYRIVMNTQHDSREACVRACQDIAGPQRRRFLFTNCQVGVEHALGWCLRYCASAYPG